MCWIDSGWSVADTTFQRYIAVAQLIPPARPAVDPATSADENVSERPNLFRRIFNKRVWRPNRFQLFQIPFTVLLVYIIPKYGTRQMLDIVWSAMLFTMMTGMIGVVSEGSPAQAGERLIIRRASSGSFLRTWPCSCSTTPSLRLACQRSTRDRHSSTDETWESWLSPLRLLDLLSPAQLMGSLSFRAFMRLRLSSD